MENSLNIGIDIGATDAKIYILNLSTNESVSLVYKGLNYRSVNIDQYLGYLNNIIAFIKRNIATPIHRISMGIAGCSNQITLKKIEEELRKTYDITFTCKSDAEIALADCNTDNRVPILVILGTGSVIVSRSDDQIIQHGGWGYLFDETNGSSGIGRMAIQYLTQLIDCELMDSTFLAEYQAFYNTEDLTEVIKSIYQSGSVQQNLAKASEPILELWEQNHPKSEFIINTFCARISKKINAMCKRLNSEKELFFSGGLITHYPKLKQNIIQHLENDLFISEQHIIPERGALTFL